MTAFEMPAEGDLFMETLKEYKDRVYSFMKNEISEEKEFHTHAGLSGKVSEDGLFRTFAGDTVVFLLDDNIKSVMKEYQNIFYEQCPEILAERIDPSTFHITLHDLCSGWPSEELWHQSQQNLTAVMPVLSGFQRKYASLLHVRPVAVFNMMNTSIVLGLEPADESSCKCLMEMYENLQLVKALPYPLTIHITLAYFKPGVYDKNTVCRLKNGMKKINDKNIPVFDLSIHQLKYQRFDSMNHYESV